VPEIQSPDPGRKLQEKYNLIGSTPAPFLSPELVPVVLIDDLTEQRPGPLFATAAAEVAGVAARNAQTRLSNPAGSGMIIADISLSYASTGTGRVEIYTGGPALTSTATPLFEDRRVAGSPAAVVTFGTDLGAVAGNQFFSRLLGNTPITVPLPNVVLAAGDLLHLIHVLAAAGMNFTWFWTEEPIKAGG